MSRAIGLGLMPEMLPADRHLAEVCNRRDYSWRVKINCMLAKDMSLQEIAEKLNHQAVPTPHGGPRWLAATVRKAFVS